MVGDITAVSSLYRSFRRQVRLLPTEYLRQFFRIKLGDDVRAVLDAKDSDRWERKVYRVRKELSKMEKANRGCPSRFRHILDMAYGRKGPLRYEFMKPLLSDPSKPLPSRIISSVEKSRPPVYSPELTVLLTTSDARRTKAIDPKAIKTPPKLPAARVDPASEEARLLGPLSKRREVNARWRYFSDQWKKVYPPSQVVLQTKSPTGEMLRSTDPESLRRAGIRGVALQGTGIPEEVEAMATQHPRASSVNSPRSSRYAEAKGSGALSREIRSPLTPRFVRRQFQQLLGRMPTLTYQHTAQDRSESDLPRPRSGRYQVSISPLAISSGMRWSPVRAPPTSESHLAWIRFAEESEERERVAMRQAREDRHAKRAVDENARVQ